VKNLILSTSIIIASSTASASELNNLTYSLEMGASNYFIAPSAQYSINSQFKTSTAAGIFLAEASASLYYDVGLIYYPFGQGFRTSLNYGTHVVHEKKTGTVRDVNFGSARSVSGDDNYSFPTSTGFSLGLGYDWANSQGGWKIDLMYILSSSADDSKELEGYSRSTTTSEEFSTTTTTSFSQSSSMGPSGSGDAWLKLSYQF
jgi:hypothetical protein